MTNKKNRQKTSTQVSKMGANASANRQTQPQGKPKKKARIVPASSGDHYKLALMNPFSEAALGVRVPDQFYAPTATLTLRECITITNDNEGNADCIFLPNVINPVFSTRRSISNGTALTLPDGTSYVTSTVVNNPLSLYNKVTNHRVVSWGLRIRNTSSLTNAQGALTVALVPIHERMRVPTNAPIGGQTASGTGQAGFSMGRWLEAAGVPSVGAGTTAKVDITSLLDFPHHARYQGPQLSEETFEVHPKLTSPSGLFLRNSDDSPWGSDMQATVSSVFVKPGDASYLMCDGWTAVVIGYSGGSTNTGTQSFEVEAVYHIEGSPNVSAGTIFITDSPVSQHNPVAALTAQAALNSMPTFTRVGGAAMAAFRSFTR